MDFRKHFNILLLMATFGLPSFAAPISTEVRLHLVFDNYVNAKPLRLDTANYLNEAGQPFIVTKFKYYVCNIRFTKTNGETVSAEGYFLVNEEDEQSKKLILEHLPPGDYSGVGFTIGVDSLHNCSGAQSGALDPVNAMFWTWNSGYIFLKLEGKSPASASPGHIFEMHIGGYKAPVNCIRNVSLKFDKPVNIGEVSEVHIKADVAAILKSPTVIDFSKLSSVTDAHNATTIADNYAGMFSILSVR